MDFWAENQGHLPQYSKYNTLPSRSCSHNYHDRQPPPQYQAYCEDQRGKHIDPGYYWPPRDTSNWSNQESTAPTSPVQFPFNLDHPIQHYHGNQRQELQDWTTYQHQGFEQEGWPYNPVHYKREISKKNDNNFRELEAWALRYSHSLPRRRRIEAGLRGTMPDNMERRDMQMTNMQESTLRDRASRQQVIHSYQTMPQRQNLEVKDKLSYQTKLYSQPPNYNAPPAYSVQYRSVLTPQKLAKQNYELPQIGNKIEKVLNEKFPVKGLDILQENRQMVQRRSSSNAAKVIEGRKFQLNKKAGGLTIFCLVSRIADTEPEMLPVSQKQNEVPSPKASSVSQSLKLADEVDFKIPTSTTKHVRSPYSKLQAIPICKESLSKMADKNAQRSNEVSVIGKLAAKFPLWRRPSFTSSTDTDNTPITSLKETLDSNLQDQEKDTKSDIESQREGTKNDDQDNGSKSDVEHQRIGTKDGNATLIDTTCVVVKMDLLKAPKKQQVQYLNSENQTKTEENLVSATTQCNQDIQTEQKDSRNAEDFKTAEQTKSEDAVEKTKSEYFSTRNSETLEDRAKRICGLYESTVLQLRDNFTFGVENVTKQSCETNELKDESSDQKKCILNVSTMSKSENLQPLQVNSCKDEEMERSSDILEVGMSEESIMKPEKDFETDSEVQKLQMAENLEQESVVEAISGQCGEPAEMSDSTDILPLELIKEEGDNDILKTLKENNNLQHNVQQHLENRAAKQLESEVEEHIEGLRENKNDATQPVLTVRKVEHLPENISDQQDQDVTKVSEGSSDLDTSTKELEMHEITKNMKKLYSGQIEDAPTLEQSENKQNPCVKLTETADVELCGCNMTEGKSVLKDETTCSTDSNQDGDEDIKGATPDFEIQEKRVETIHEIENQSEILDESMKKELSDVMEQEDTWIASNENANDSEESENEKQFGCRNKACANEEGCITKNSIEETLLGSDEGIEPATLTVPKVETLSDVEQKTGKEEEIVKVKLTKFLEGENDEAFSVDNAISSRLEIKKTIDQNDNTEFGQEKSEICAKDSIVLAQNLEADHLEITHGEEVVKNIDRFDLQNKEEREEEIIGATCSKLHSETAAILVEDNEQANETEIQKDMDLKEKILDEIGKIDASDCDFNDFILEECEWEDNTVDDNIIKDGLNAKDPDNEICQATKSEDNLQPQVYPSDKEITVSRLVCQPDSNVNTSSVTSTDISEQPHPSSSTIENDNCETTRSEEERKYPKSLWDAVNRIRKHTAPDSENEEEEVIDNWDRESLVSVESVCENLMKQGDIDLMQSELWFDDLNMQDETLSQCSNSSQESDGTIVDDELEVTQMTDDESVEICDGEGQSVSENENTMNQNQIEESPDEGLDKQAEIAEDIML